MLLMNNTFSRCKLIELDPGRKFRTKTNLVSSLCKYEFYLDSREFQLQPYL